MSPCPFWFSGKFSTLHTRTDRDPSWQLVLRHIEQSRLNELLLGRDAPDKSLRSDPAAMDEAKDLLGHHEVGRARVERVTRLVGGLESPYDLQLLVTVHWVMNRECAFEYDGVMREVYDGDAHKRQFTRLQRTIAEERLRSQGGLSPEVAEAH